MSDELRKSALDYHRYPRPGKLAIQATKPLANQRDLALAYSPGVAAACEEIVADPLAAALYTSRGNLVAVITNGTAVLGLGAIGALASKPVMEGKAVLFKQFADIDVFDIEIDELDPEQLIATIARLEPSFGGINLEDIKAPECFIVEKALKERMKIPVFHDDQHGTAIVVSAAVLNGLRLVGKEIGEARLVTAGAGAAALACLDLLVSLGLKREQVIVTDIAGVVYEGRTEVMDPYKARYAINTPLRTLEEALEGADIFLGLSAAGILKAPWLLKMAPNPLVFALANPNPEIAARGGAGGPPRRHPGNRPDGLSQSGQQRSLLSLSLSWCPGLWCHRDQRSHEARLCSGYRRSGPGPAFGDRPPGLRWHGPAFWPRVPHPQALRSPSHRAGRPGGGRGRHGLGCRHPAHRGYGRLSPDYA